MFERKVKEVHESIGRLIGSYESYIDYLLKDRDMVKLEKAKLKQENQQLRRLLVAKFKEANKEIELTELDIRV